MHSVLFLILAFFNAAGLFVLLGAEFLAMILVVVYVGAVAVLFLFVVMMLDVDFAELRAGLHQVCAARRAGRADPARPSWSWCSALHAVGAGALASAGRADPAAGSGITNTEALGRVLYTDYVFYFQVAGLILLVAMIGAIVLTLRHKPGRQAPVDRRAGGAHAGDGHRDGQGRPGERSSRGGSEAQLEAHDHRHSAHYLTVAAILFTLGMFGIFLNRKNIIVILMSIELMLLAVNINFVAFSAFLGDLVGQVFALFVLTVAAAEAAIGLAILVVFFRNRGSIAVEDINMMKG